MTARAVFNIQVKKRVHAGQDLPFDISVGLGTRKTLLRTFLLAFFELVPLSF